MKASRPRKKKLAQKHIVKTSKRKKSCFFTNFICLSHYACYFNLDLTRSEVNKYSRRAVIPRLGRNLPFHVSHMDVCNILYKSHISSTSSRVDRIRRDGLPGGTIGSPEQQRTTRHRGERGPMLLK